MTDIGKILRIGSGEEFEKAALELFAFQAERCAPYGEYLAAIGVNPADVARAGDIPHLPIEIFRSREVYCCPRAAEKVFTSSTTGGDIPSKHYIASLADYRKTFVKAFSLFYGDPAGWSFYCLLPGYLEREGSSLACMADGLVGLGGGGFFLNNYEELITRIDGDPKKKILLGVSYALWELAEKYAPKLGNTVVMETGGMKGKREELPKEKFHKILEDAFGAAEIHSEYGMAELSSQAYSRGGGIFRTPPWMKVRIRDINDPFSYMPDGSSGGVNITDLANIHSCAFIQTQDLGISYADGTFRILGRIDRSQTRGCNLMLE